MIEHPEDRPWFVDQLTKSAFFHQKLHEWKMLPIAEAIEAIRGEDLSWEKIEYKAIERGIAVVYVDPRHTSQRCLVCGHISRNNRHKHLFKCASCGYTANADINACRNIRQVYLDTLPDGPLSTGLEASTA